jgi:hypothetical protein
MGAGTPQIATAAWRDCDRLRVLAMIEDASGGALDTNDPLPDALIATAQALGIMPVHLRMWAYDVPHRADWTTESLRRFVREGGAE